MDLDVAVPEVTEDLGERAPGPVRAVVGLGAYGVACTAFLAVRGRSWELVAVGVAAVVVTALVAHRALREQLLSSPRPIVRRLCLAAFPVLGLVLLGGWLTTDRPDGWGFLGVASSFLGAGLVVGVLRERESTRRHGHVALAGCLGAVLVGLILVVVGAQVVGALLVVAGLLLTPGALNVASELVLRRPPLRHGRWLAVGGLVLFAAGLVVAATVAGIGWTYLAVGGGVLLVMIASITNRSNIDVVFVVLAAAVVWAAMPRTVPDTDEITVSDGDEVLVAMGDSFMSGEGAEHYFDGTNSRRLNECRRAPTAYAAALASSLGDRGAERGEKVLFLACSGAVADNLVSSPQFAHEPVPEVVDGTGVEGMHQLQQLQTRRGDLDIDVRAVLVSVGGNDALFGSIARACVLPGTCSELAPAWSEHLVEVGARLGHAYGEIRRGVGDDVPIVVVPYPVPLADRRCGYSTLTTGEHRVLHDFTQQLNAVVQEQAAVARFHVVDTMPEALRGRRLCDARSPKRVGVNFLAAHSVRGQFEESANPVNWFHNSLHPNARGHAVMGETVVEWFAARPDLPASAEPPTSTVDPAASVSDDGPCRGLGDAEALQRCTMGWAFQQTARFGLAAAPVVLMIVGGAWLMSLEAVRRYRSWKASTMA
jgi:lysophospholipase L1-like esterase